jgi:hypothetical protein
LSPRSGQGIVIVVVEGPSASGKTSWVTRHCDPATVVPETTTLEAVEAPDQAEQPEEAAEFWTTLNSARWEQARRIEQRHGIAVCDSDPFKLHYTWSLWRVGLAGHQQWTRALEANRQAFDSSRLGIADLILVTIPDAATLTRHRQEDRSRQRHNFDLHLQLVAPLAEWYHAIEELDPKRVLWQLPSQGVASDLTRREPNSGTELFDSLVARLPGGH